MQLHLAPHRKLVERPSFARVAIVLEVLTGICAIPVGWSMLQDPTGRAIGLPQGWIEATPFGSYTLPGLYLLVVNGGAMLAAAALGLRRHWTAPWLTGALGVGMIIWILVEIVTLPETMFLTWVFLAVGLALGFVSLFWLRRTDQLRLW